MSDHTCDACGKEMPQHEPNCWRLFSYFPLPITWYKPEDIKRLFPNGPIYEADEQP